MAQRSNATQWQIFRSQSAREKRTTDEVLSWAMLWIMSDMKKPKINIMESRTPFLSNRKNVNIYRLFLAVGHNWCLLYKERFVSAFLENVKLCRFIYILLWQQPATDDARVPPSICSSQEFPPWSCMNCIYVRMFVRTYVRSIMYIRSAPKGPKAS